MIELFTHRWEGGSLFATALQTETLPTAKLLGDMIGVTHLKTEGDRST